jgi:hypothetical protein
MPTSIDLIKCPGCGQLVDPAFYKLHADGDATNGPHKLHIVNIAGMGGPEIITTNPKGPVMINVPYLGRLRRDAFLAWSFLMLLLGILLGSGKI